MEKINFTNGQEPAINGANLNLMQTNAENAINDTDKKIGTLGNLTTSDKTDLVNAVNEINGRQEVVLHEGMLMGGQALDLDMKEYKRLLITFCAYDGSDTNTGGVSNILMLDLESHGAYAINYTAGILVPYMVNLQNQGTMWCYCEVDNAKKTFFPYVGFGANTFNNSDRYYVSKIIGVK